MLRQILVQKEESQFKINTQLTAENSAYLTKLLFDYVEQGKIDFELKSKKGSVISEILVNVLGGLFSAILYDLIKKIYHKLKDERKKDEEIKPVHIFTTKEEFVITGDKNSKIPEELKKELFLG